ncbi:MAG TPA: ABC transporter substrate-binding protein [Pseudolabrys sp.]|nr:ABC transporter substrate-binding protein [Pseudolabrys sp.]
MASNRQSKACGPSRRAFLRSSAGIGLAAAAGARIRPARAAEKINFQLDWIPYGRHAPYYAALENGFYSAKGLDVSIAQGRGTLQGIRTLIAGQSQFVFQDLGVMMAVRAKEHAKIMALACMYQKSPHTVFYIKGRGISKPKDLEGKKIAFSPGDSPRLMFPAFAKANGIDESKIKWLSVDPNSKNAVLLNHSADAMITYLFTLPVLQKAAQGGDVVETFVYSDYGADFYSNGLGAMEDYVKAKPDVTRNFVHATMEGVKFTIEHPKEAVAMLKKHQPQLDVDTAIKEVAILRKLIDYDHHAGPLGSITQEKMKATQDLMVKYLDLKNPPPVAETFTNKFLS